MKAINYLKDKGRFLIAFVVRRPRRKQLINTIEYLWQIIDDIDTASDMAKSNNEAYRIIVEKKQKLRWKTGITTNGYDLDISKIKEIDISNIAWL